MDDRAIHFEERLAYLEKGLDDLNAVVYELSKAQQRLAAELRALRSQATPTDPDREPDEDIPPHYGDIRPG